MPCGTPIFAKNVGGFYTLKILPTRGRPSLAPLLGKIIVAKFDRIVK